MKIAYFILATITAISFLVIQSGHLQLEREKFEDQRIVRMSK